MKIDFPDKSFIEITKHVDKIIVIISAIDPQNSLKRISNSVELTQEQFTSLTKDL